MRLSYGTHQLDKVSIWGTHHSYQNYLFSIDGEVISLPRPRAKGGKLALVKKGDGYIQVSLSEGAMVKRPRLHTILGEIFLSAERNEVINHINHIKSDNSIENLEYTTQRKNVNHGNRTPLGNSLRLREKKESTKTTLSKEQVLKIKSMSRRMSGQKIASHLKVNVSSVNRVIAARIIHLIPYRYGNIIETIEGD